MNAVLEQAIRDLLFGSLPESLDAALFLAGPDFPWWAEAVGTPDRDGVQFLTSGQARKARRIFERRQE